jgi:hypothetical protein
VGMRDQTRPSRDLALLNRGDKNEGRRSGPKTKSSCEQTIRGENDEAKAARRLTNRSRHSENQWHQVKGRGRRKSPVRDTSRNLPSLLGIRLTATREQSQSETIISEISNCDP